MRSILEELILHQDAGLTSSAPTSSSVGRISAVKVWPGRAFRMPPELWDNAFEAARPTRGPVPGPGPALAFRRESGRRDIVSTLRHGKRRPVERQADAGSMPATGHLNHPRSRPGKPHNQAERGRFSAARRPTTAQNSPLGPSSIAQSGWATAGRSAGYCAVDRHPDRQPARWAMLRPRSSGFGRRTPCEARRRSWTIDRRPAQSYRCPSTSGRSADRGITPSAVNICFPVASAWTYMAWSPA